MSKHTTGTHAYTVTFDDSSTLDVTAWDMARARATVPHEVAVAHGGVVGIVRAGRGFEVVKTGLSKADEAWLATYTG